MIKKFVTNYSKDGIDVIDVIRETDKCVFLKAPSSWPNGERRELKSSDGRCYFDDFEEAKSHLRSLVNESLDRLEESLEYSRAKKEKIENISCL